MEKHIKKCDNFKRAFGSSGEVAWCEVKGFDMRCGGFSDLCPIPEKFRAQDKTPREMVIFKNERTT